MIMDFDNITKQPVTCPTCSKTLSSRQNLRQHMNIHTGEKPFKCNYLGCSLSFKHASQLSNHKSTHQQILSVGTNSFDDLGYFLRLVVKVFNSSASLKKTYQKRKANMKKVELPLISSPQIQTKLPKFSDLESFMSQH
jgi:uncharacterized Zn-finger protein